MPGSAEAPRTTLDETPPRFDPFEPGFFDDPYPHYARLRERNPIHANDRGVVFCFAYDDVRALLIDARRTSMDRERAMPRVAGTSAVAAPTFPLGVINRDPPDHTRLRRLLARTFTARRIDRLMASMERQLDELLTALERRARATTEPVDLAADLAFPFPFRVISELLGMPDGDDLQLRTWAQAVSGASDPTVSREQIAIAIAAYRELSAYLTHEVLPWKRRHPDDDLLTQLLAAEADSSLSTVELVDNATLLYVAGHETTSGQIGNGILNLLRHRAQLDRILAEPALLPNAVDELTRYESSVQFAWRYVVDDVELRDGVVLRRGTMAFVCCGSANRDPGHFGTAASTLDVERTDASDLLSFGAGIHYCLGAPLARRETALVISRLFARFPDLDLADTPRWGRRSTFRSLDELPVDLGLRDT
jgi:cytochrome P450